MISITSYRVLPIWQQRLGGNQSDVAATLNNLAQIAKLTGRFAEAERLYRAALETREAALGPDSVAYGLGLGNLGDLFRTEGRLFGASALYRHSLRILEPKLGPEHASVQTVAAGLQASERANRRQRDQMVDYRKLGRR